MKKIIKLLFMYMLLSACTPKAQSITYGADMCHFCKMNIVDVQHASEIVTKKGKVFKYDAIECMLNSEEHQAPEKNALYLTNVYGQPEILVNAIKVTYLISERLPSPMGANLTAFETESAALKAKEELGGEIYSWSALLTRFSK